MNCFPIPLLLARFAQGGHPPGDAWRRFIEQRVLWDPVRKLMLPKPLRPRQAFDRTRKNHPRVRLTREVFDESGQSMTA